MTAQVVQSLTRHRYSDSEYEYRHVQLPKAMLKVIPRDYFDDSKGTLKLLWEEEWRGLGITQVQPSVQTQGNPATDKPAESRLGTLRGSRARTTYPAIQVRRPAILCNPGLADMIRRPIGYQAPAQ